MDQLSMLQEQTLKKVEFLEINKKLKEDKRIKEVRENERERLNFFPFTHGDAIEQQREVLKGETKKYLTQM